jgi:tetratricopeptide (TPR) repeat protein
VTTGLSLSSEVPAPPSRPPRAGFKREFLHVALIAIAAALVYSNTLANSFHLDDYYRVVNNPGIQTVSPVWRHFTDPRTMSTLDRITQYRPLLPLTLSFDYALGGYDAAGYHIVNIVLQIAAGVLVYFLVIELLEYGSRSQAHAHNGRLALLVALLFTVHPIAGILVNYVSSRDLLLMQVFLLASLFLYLRMRRSGFTRGRWAVVLALLALSILSKTNAAAAPLLIVAFEVTVGRERLTSSAPWRRALPFAVVVAGYFLFTRFVLGFSDMAQVRDPAMPAWTYAVTQMKLALFHYAQNFVWPFPIRQSPLVQPSFTLFDPLVLLGLAFIVLTLVAAWRLRDSAPVISFCILAAWILMIPESSLLPLYHLAVDYRPYPSSAFVFLAVGTALERYIPARASLVLAAFVVYLALASYFMNRTWRTDETLWTHSVEYGGDALAHMNLAMSLRDRTDPRVRQNLEEALRLSPNYVLAHINLGLLLIDLGQAEQGLAEVRRAVQLTPRWAQAHYWLARAYARLGRYADAAGASATAAQLDPRNLSYQYQAAMDAQRVGNYASALQHVGEVEKVRPDYEETQFIKGFALQMTGRVEEAIPALEAFLAAHPGHVQAEFDLGHALMTAKRCPEAIPHFESVLAGKPDYAAAHLHLSTCYAEAGNEAKASAHKAAYEASRQPDRR